jgi:CelD/BcsL family acetyltransferase involved in cellulose biosynthesis
MSEEIVVRRISSLEELAPLASAWDELLLRDPLTSVFLSYEWVSAWWAHFGRNADLWVLIATLNGELLGVAPLMRRRTRLGYRLEFIGIPNLLSDRVGFLVDPARAPEVVDGFYSWLVDNRLSWHVWELKNIPEDSLGWVALRKLFRVRGILRWREFLYDTCPYLPVADSWDGLLVGAKRRRLRGRLKNAQNRLRRLGTMSFEQHRDLESITSVWPCVVELNERSAQYRRGLNIFLGRGHREFFDDVVCGLAPHRWVVLSILRLDGVAIACDLSFFVGGRLSGYSQAQDPVHASTSLFTFIVGQILQAGLGKGLKEVDFSTGAQDVKYRWTDLSRRHLRVVVVRRGALPWLLHILPAEVYQFLKERAILRRLKQRIDRLRRARWVMRESSDKE